MNLVGRSCAHLTNKAGVCCKMTRHSKIFDLILEFGTTKMKESSDFRWVHTKSLISLKIVHDWSTVHTIVQLRDWVTISCYFTGWKALRLKEENKTKWSPQVWHSWRSRRKRPVQFRCLFLSMCELSVIWKHAVQGPILQLRWLYPC